jgi:hypothetical protein
LFALAAAEAVGVEKLPQAELVWLALAAVVVLR